MAVKIPVFVSAPTELKSEQKYWHKKILQKMEQHCFEYRALGKSDYPVSTPLREVYSIASHCSGGIILGFSKYTAEKYLDITKEHAEPSHKIKHLPTPWNQLEAGILFGLSLPLLVFKEKEIDGGIFDPGTADIYLHEFPDNTDWSDEGHRIYNDTLNSIFLRWGALVRNKYYGGI